MGERNEGLMWSVKNGELESVQDEIKSGADVNAELNNGRCPLHIAADFGQTDVIKCLLENGADINKVDKHGITPILAAIWEGHLEAVKLLLEKGAKTDKPAPDGTNYIECAETEEIKSILQGHSK